MKTVLSTLALIAATMFVACKKEQLATFEVPSTYRYNSPHMDARYTYAINAAGKPRLLADTIGTFNRDNSEIADSINFYIERDFLTESLRKVSFEANNTALLEFARLDTTGGIDKFIDVRTQSTPYTLTGNDIVLSGFPQYKIVINNSFLELHLCREYTFRSFSQDTSQIKRYYNQNCTDTSNNPDKVVARIIADNPSIKYDTMSVEFVSHIFSKY